MSGAEKVLKSLGLCSFSLWTALFVPLVPPLHANIKAQVEGNVLRLLARERLSTSKDPIFPQPTQSESGLNITPRPPLLPCDTEQGAHRASPQTAVSGHRSWTFRKRAIAHNCCLPTIKGLCLVLSCRNEVITHRVEKRVQYGMRLVLRQPEVDRLRT
ncbi:hypothetical protein BC827DRAFT_860372 [Russula dissimulans]|nr:hypothetical protein BC827DRAFT_860372 [Russula dissimulans]